MVGRIITSDAIPRPVDPERGDHRWRCLEERVTAPDGCSTPEPEDVDAEIQYVWGERYIDDLVFRDRDTTGNGTLNERLYAIQDANWNVVALANSSGAVQERFIYSAYGTPSVLNADFTAKTGGTGFDWEFLFTGRRLDGESGLMYYRYRVYHVGLGRFVSRDPIGYEDGMNAYQYCQGLPALLSDPEGLQAPVSIYPPNQTPNGYVSVAGEVYPKSCFKCDMKCGPEVGKAVLNAMLHAKNRLNKLTLWQKVKIQANLLRLKAPPWDIDGLVRIVDSGRFGNEQVSDLSTCYKQRRGTICETCVRVFGVKQDAFEVNYMLWGLAFGDIGWTVFDAYAYAILHKGVAKPLFYPEKEACRPKWQWTSTLQDWISVGYSMSSNARHYGNSDPVVAFHRNRPRQHNQRYADCGVCKTNIPGPLNYHFDFVEYSQGWGSRST